MAAAVSAADAAGKAQAGGDRDAVRVVVQRCNRAKLVLDNAERHGEIGRGLVVFVSLGVDADEAAALKAATALAHLPLSTAGEWGDGAPQESLVKLLLKGVSQGVLVVPQACLTAKVKGRAIKYHRQLEKEEGRRLYAHFVSSLERALLEGILADAFRNKWALEYLERVTGCKAGEGVLPPEAYGAFNKRGVPTAMADGAPLPKATVRACDAWSRAVASHLAQSRTALWLELQAAQAAPEAEGAAARLAALRAKLPPPPLALVAGTFGNRQGLELSATLGPSTHVLTF